MSKKKEDVRIYNKKKQVFDGLLWRPCCSMEGCNNRTTRKRCIKCSYTPPQDDEIKWTSGKGGMVKRIYRERFWRYCCKKCDEVTVTHANATCFKCKTGKSFRKYQHTKDYRGKMHIKFLEKIKLMSPNISIVGNYINLSTPIEALCKIHDKPFKQRPAKIIIGQLGCKMCSRENKIKNCRKSHEDFAKEAKEIHGDLFNYPEEYKGAHMPIDILCIKHDRLFKQTPNGHVTHRNNGCPKCHKYGKMEEEYIKFISLTKNKPNLQHKFSKNNPKQKKILNYKIDAYDEETKTCYEFNGCFWHGCSCQKQKYNNNKKYMKLMEKRLLNTKQRKDTIQKEGYKVISMWECDWTRRKKLFKSILPNKVRNGSGEI